MSSRSKLHFFVAKIVMCLHFLSTLGGVAPSETSTTIPYCAAALTSSLGRQSPVLNLPNSLSAQKRNELSILYLFVQLYLAREYRIWCKFSVSGEKGPDPGPQPWL